MSKIAVHLSDDERQELERLVRSGSRSVRLVRRAQILLRSADGLTDEAIRAALGVSLQTIHNVRQQAATEGVNACLNRRAGRKVGQVVKALDGAAEAHLIALTCSEPPAGRERWTLRLLAERMVQLEYVTAVSHETVRQVLKKNETKPWLKQMWCIPPKANAAFVAEMEQVLDVYQRPADLRFPVICMDESNKQLLADVQPALPIKPGQIQKIDCNYLRHGTGNLFLAFEPARGRREVMVTERRTRHDWAHYVKFMVDDFCPSAERITLVCDQLNTPSLASLYETFAPEEAHRLARKLELIHTPKHGSWLNMAEIEFSALSRQCLDRRIPDRDVLAREVAAWAKARNDHQTTVHWRFTTADARIKLKSLYPQFLP